MMRFNSPYDLFIRISMILNLFSVLSTCNEICQHPDWTNFKKVIFVNESYRYSHHYHYSQTISLNQPHTDVNCSFIKLEDFEDMQTPFSLKYFGTQVSKFRIYSNGVLNIFENNEPIGQILNELYDYESRYRLIQKGLIAFKWVADTKFKITHTAPIVTTLIYANGKISIYYENILSEINENETMAGILVNFQCDTGKTEHKIAVPVEWIKSGTLVEYEFIGTICPIHNSSEACQKATTSKTTCIWCEKWNTCIDSNHQDHHFLKVNGCHFKNATIEITQESGQNKSLWYLYIVIPSVIFFAVCIGYVIWRWLYKRRRYNE